MRLVWCVILATTLSGCGAMQSAGRVIGEILAAGTPPAAALPRTTAERTNYRETSRYDAVVAFIDSLQALGLPIHVGSIGRSTEGRDIPYIIASRPLVSTPAEARRLGRPVIYVQGNIHAGEVEGKEALLALVRDLVASNRKNALDSIVLIAVPIYNTDGNERVASQDGNRSNQNGPEIVGERANGQRLDLNRDYIKAEAPETRASLAMFERWDPEVFVDLHTTNGSYHGYALTYSPSLSPAAMDGGAFARDSLLPELRRRMRGRHSFETFDYGNFSLDFADPPTDTIKKGWFTYDHRPRFGTNYYGIRGRIAILSEAYSHDPFERRVKATYAFVSELLSLAAEQRAEIITTAAVSDARLAATAARTQGAARRLLVPVRSELTKSPLDADVIVEDMVSTGDSTVTEPGVPRGLRRTGRFRTQRMPVHDRFTPTLERALPAAYAIPDRSGLGEVVALLRMHGLRVERLEREWRASVEVMTIDSVSRATRAFQGHNEVTLRGTWRSTQRTLERGSFIVTAAQPLGVLAAYLLEPESDDGFVTWNAFDAMIRRGEEFPVIRVVEPVTAPRREVRAP